MAASPDQVRIVDVGGLALGTNKTPRALSAQGLPQAGKLAASLNRRKP